MQKNNLTTFSSSFCKSHCRYKKVRFVLPFNIKKQDKKSLHLLPTACKSFCNFASTGIILLGLSEAQDGLRKFYESNFALRNRTHSTFEHYEHRENDRSGTKTTYHHHILENFCPLYYYSIMYTCTQE